MKNRDCQICGNKIPYRKVIDGRERILSSRKRCLKCSPFGKQGKKTSIPGNVVKTMKNYSNWKEEWKEEHRQRTLKKGRKKKDDLIEHCGGECIKCGYKGVPRTMSFHHRNPKEKSFELSSSGLRNHSWQEIIEEVSKCDLLCIRCHLEIEHEIYIKKSTIAS